MNEFSRAQQSLAKLQRKRSNGLEQGLSGRDIPATLADLIEIYEVLIEREEPPNG